MEYFVFKYLWLIVLLPKTAQLGCFGTIAVIMAYKSNKAYKINGDSVNFSFLVPNILFLLAIIISTITHSHDMDRIFAAVNTCLITFIAILFYNLYSKANIDYERISRYMFMNFIILCAMWLTYKVLKLQVPSILGRSIGGLDYLYGVQTTRFSAYLEYVNLVVYMVIYTFSMSIYYAYKNFNNIIYLLYSIFPLFIVLATNSRTGLPIAIVLSSVAMGVKFFDAIYSCYINNRLLFIILVLFLLFVFVILFHSLIFDVLSDALMKREGSTNTRSALYNASIKKMLDESPIIGCGIKDIWNSLPYGSHSTFLGMFYKTGILGGTIFFCGIFVTSINILKMKIFTKNILVLKIAYYCLIAISLLEDLDGSDWNIVLFMIFLAILKKHDLYEMIITERKNSYEYASTSEYNCSGV